MTSARAWAVALCEVKKPKSGLGSFAMVFFCFKSTLLGAQNLRWVPEMQSFRLCGFSALFRDKKNRLPFRRFCDPEQLWVVVTVKRQIILDFMGHHKK